MYIYSKLKMKCMVDSVEFILREFERVKYRFIIYITYIIFEIIIRAKSWPFFPFVF